MVLTNIDLKNVSLIYHKIRQKVPNGKGLRMNGSGKVVKALGL